MSVQVKTQPQKLDPLADIRGRVMFALGNRSVIYRDGKGGFRQRFLIVEGATQKEPWYIFWRCCSKEWCGYHLKRKHFTFRHCRARRVAEGSHPADFPVDLHFFTVDHSAARKNCKVKNWLIKNLKSIIEWLGD